MTHAKNYEYVKKWRELNRDKYMEIQRIDKLKRYHYKQRVKELLRIEPDFFL
jgi:hypothetical protein